MLKTKPSLKSSNQFAGCLWQPSIIYKKIRVLPWPLLLFLASLSVKVPAQSPFDLRNTSWTGTQLPLKKGLELYFQKDTLVLVDLSGMNPPDQYLMKQRQDTMQLFVLEDLSIECRNPGVASYRLHWSNNGEKLLLKPISDPCLWRFTQLVSQSPWYRKRQPDELRFDWHFLDPDKDNVPGIGLYETYKLLKNKSANPVVVAVMDSPLDYTHPDLKASIWRNPIEIEANQSDDDKNGFADDMHGWCFNCSKDGNLIENELPETTQMVQFGKSLFENKEIDAYTGFEQKMNEWYRQSKQLVNERRMRAQADLSIMRDSVYLFELATFWLNYVEEPVDQDQIKNWPTKNKEKDEPIRQLIMQWYGKRTGGYARFVRQLRQDFPSRKNRLSHLLNYDYNPDWNPRLAVGDNPTLLWEKGYGSGKLSQPNHPKHEHGTHVAGIIGAQRGNGIGIDGIASQVKIMTIGAVPNEGDERDKDIANGIKYAVDQGAKIINMSFAKRFSPHKKYVDEAVAYAEKKGVLMIHAAGNSGLNVDTALFFPNGTYLNGQSCSTWIEVGNSTSNWGQLASKSSNYGKQTVHLFAPGTQILSTLPDGEYGLLSGTSMAAPVVAGVAALIWSYYPHLKAQEVRKILLESVYQPNSSQSNPANNKDQNFKSQSLSGGILNARKAIEMAEKISRKPKG